MRRHRSSPPPLAFQFYDRHAVEVARDLLGKQLVRQTRAGLLRGRIVEVEAYLSDEDPACHAARGKTRKNASMFGPPARAYVYSIHARWCFNVVTEPEDVPSAVLIRALEPLAGLPLMQQRRATDKPLDLARGPARLCQALDIDRNLDGWDLTCGARLWIADDGDFRFDAGQIAASPRIGISAAQHLPLRFFFRGNPFVSGPKYLHAQ
jgi:DNA-3-methyladenine glycosylase